MGWVEGKKGREKETKEHPRTSGLVGSSQEVPTSLGSGGWDTTQRRHLEGERGIGIRRTGWCPDSLFLDFVEGGSTLSSVKRSLGVL